MSRPIQPPRRYSFTMLLSILAAFFIFDFVQANNLDVKESTKIVQVGEPIEMLCVAPQKIDICTVSVPGSKEEVRLVPTADLVTISDINTRVAYRGDGFEKGQCGFRIEKATENLNGVFKCSVFLYQQSTKISGSMNVTVARTPTSPELKIHDNKNNDLREGELLKATCSVKKSRPATNLTWYLGDEILFDGLKNAIYTETSDGLMSTEQNLTRTIQANDDGKELKCVANHVGLNEQNKQARKYLSVYFKPKSTAKTFERFGLVEGQEGRVSIEIEANPRPVIIWSIDGDIVTEGDSIDNYQVIKTMQKDSNHLWETTLIISKLTKEDVKRDYRVKATNKFGEEIFEVMISTNSEPENVSIGTGTIVIVLIVVSLVLLISCVILFARAKGRWCFADPMEPRRAEVIGRESSDTESAEHTTGAGKKKLSFPLVFKKKNDKLASTGGKENKDMSTTDDEDKIDTCLQKADNDVPDVVTHRPLNDGEGVVYAELDLPVRTGGGNVDLPGSNAARVNQIRVRPEEDTTEYAEIIHAQQPTQPK